MKLLILFSCIFTYVIAIAKYDVLSIDLLQYERAFQKLYQGNKEQVHIFKSGYKIKTSKVYLPKNYTLENC